MSRASRALGISALADFGRRGRGGAAGKLEYKPGWVPPYPNVAPVPGQGVPAGVVPLPSLIPGVPPAGGSCAPSTLTTVLTAALGVLGGYALAKVLS